MINLSVCVICVVEFDYCTILVPSLGCKLIFHASHQCMSAQWIKQWRSYLTTGPTATLYTGPYFKLSPGGRVSPCRTFQSVKQTYKCGLCQPISTLSTEWYSSLIHIPESANMVAVIKHQMGSF